MRSEPCSICGSRMYRLYERVRDPETRKQYYVPVAWRCSNPHCRHISQD